MTVAMGCWPLCRACKWLFSQYQSRKALQIEFGMVSEGINSAFARNKWMWMRLQSSVQRKVQKRRGGDKTRETRASQTEDDKDVINQFLTPESCVHDTRQLVEDSQWLQGNIIEIS